MQPGQTRLSDVKQVNVYEALGQFSELLEEVEAGEEIVIARNGKPVVRLVPFQAPPPGRTLGRWQGQVPVLSDEVWQSSDDAAATVFASAVGEEP
jgi:prevent-host-death family protein